MDFDLIMEEITHGLTGNSSEDLVYLKEQMEKYKDHEMGKEIVRACGRLMYTLLPDETKNELSKIMEKEDLRFDATLDEVRFNVYKKDFPKAINIMEALVKKVDNLYEAGMFREDAVSEYYCFNEFFEELLFRENHKSQKAIRRADIPFASIYFEYGSLLFEMKRYKDAQVVLEKAMRWNPCDSKIAFEHAETYKVLGDLDSFFELTKDIFKIAFSPENVARCYRNMGFFFVEKELWSEAKACFIMSLQFERESKNAQSELYYIDHVTNGVVAQPTMDQLREYSAKYGFPVGADNDVLGLAYAYGKHFFEKKQYDGAKYFWTILYRLTDDEEIKRMLEVFPHTEA